MYKPFDIAEADSKPSLLDVQAAKTVSNPQPPKHMDEEVEEEPAAKKPTGAGKPKKPASDDEMGMDEEPVQQKPAKAAYEGPTHPLEKDLVILSQEEFTQYLGLLKVAKPKIEQAEIAVPDMVNYDKDSMSLDFLGIAIHMIEPQAAAFVNQNNSDMAAAKRCNDNILAMEKKKNQMMRGLESQKITLQDYKGVLKREFDKFFKIATFMKKNLKFPKVQKFIIARVQIIDTEMKTVDEALKNM